MNRRSRVGRVEWRTWAGPLVLAVALTCCSALTLPHWGEPKHGSDKLIHVILFGLLANLIGRIEWVRRDRAFGIYAAVFIVSFFGAVDELHQHFTPGRSMDVMDWMADTLGALAATIFYDRSLSYRRGFEALVARCAASFGGARGGPDETATERDQEDERSEPAIALTSGRLG